LLLVFEGWGLTPALRAWSRLRHSPFFFLMAASVLLLTWFNTRFAGVESPAASSFFLFDGCVGFAFGLV